MTIQQPTGLPGDSSLSCSVEDALPGSSAKYPILLNGVPKAGSGLLRAIVLAVPGARWAGHIEATRELHTRRERLRRVRDRVIDLSPGSVYAAHIPYAPEIARWLHQQGIKQLFIFRDPRDVTVSLQHFVLQPMPAPWQALFTRLGSKEDRLMAAIRGIGRGQREYEVSASAYPSVRLDFEAYLGWMNDSESHAIRYEDLISSTPANRADTARSTVVDMLAHIGASGYAPHDSLVQSILAKGMDPSRSHTFRRGISGAWREEYTREHLAVFDSVAGDLLERLGYT